ncbi:MAG: M48 family metalloprotease [Acidobacteria bacterium]|nr:M48 family metalloprotease [Acidobacteriota bacterium]
MIIELYLKPGTAPMIDVTIWDLDHDAETIGRLVSNALPCPQPEVVTGDGDSQEGADYSAYARSCASRSTTVDGQLSEEFDLQLLKSELLRLGARDVSLEVMRGSGYEYVLTPVLNRREPASLNLDGSISDIPDRLEISMTRQPYSLFYMVMTIAAGLFGLSISLAVLGVLALRSSERMQSRWVGVVNWSWLQYVFLGIWYFVGYASGFQSVVAESLAMLSGSELLIQIIQNGFYLWPVILALTFHVAILQPLETRMKSTPWSWSERVQTTFWTAVSIWGPMPMLFVALGGLGTYGLQTFAQLGAAWAAICFIAVRQLKGVNSCVPFEVNDGELLTRTRELAVQVGAPLKRLLIIPADKSGTVNAFATSNGDVMLSERLVAELTQKEVDSVIGHELTHLKLKHPETLTWVWIASSAVALALWWQLPGWGLLLWWGWVLVTAFASRIIERQADKGAIDVVGGAEAFVTSQAKLAALNQMPEKVSTAREVWQSHPSTHKRIAAAANSVGMGDADVQVLFKKDEVDGAHYELPARDDEQVFSVEAYAALAVRDYLLCHAVGVVPSLLAGVAVYLISPSLTVVATIYALVGTMICLACLLDSKLLPSPQLRAMQRLLQSKLAVRGWPVEGSDSYLAGLSPQRQSMWYGTQNHWDVGYFFLAEDELVYVGERVEFRMRRDQVVEMEFESPSWELGGGRDGVLHWRDNASSRDGWIRFVPLTVGWAERSDEQPIIAGLKKWAARGGAAQMPAMSAALGLPEDYDPTGTPRGEAGSLTGTLRILAVSAAASAAAAATLIPGSFGGSFLDSIGWHVVALTFVGQASAFLTYEIARRRGATANAFPDEVIGEPGIAVTKSMAARRSP